MNWAQADNSLIRDLKDFTATFFEKRTLVKVLLDFSVSDVSDTLLVMRPYQIAATQKLVRRQDAWQAGKRRIYLAHDGLRQDADQLQGGPPGNGTRFH